MLSVPCSNGGTISGMNDWTSGLGNSRVSAFPTLQFLHFFSQVNLKHFPLFWVWLFTFLRGLISAWRCRCLLGQSRDKVVKVPSLSRGLFSSQFLSLFWWNKGSPLKKMGRSSQYGRRWHLRPQMAILFWQTDDTTSIYRILEGQGQIIGTFQQ